MIIEALVIAFLQSNLTVPVYAERPEKPDPSYVIVEKVGGDETNQIPRATLAVQSHAGSMLEAATLNAQVKRVMKTLIEDDRVSRCHINSDYNFTDEETKTYRYQAVFDITYYEEE